MIPCSPALRSLRAITRWFTVVILTVALVWVAQSSEAGGALALDRVLASMPAGYALQEFDDCGVPGRQAHVRETGIHSYRLDECRADERARTVSWGWKAVHIDYTGLDAGRQYAAAVTYGNETFNGRIQSLWAGTTCLHAARPLPLGGSERVVVSIPADEIHDGKLTLECRLEGPVNVVVSCVELWSDAPAKPLLRLEGLSGLAGDLQGSVLDLAYNPVAQADVRALATGGAALATARTGDDGTFRVPAAALSGMDSVRVVAAHAGLEAAVTLTADDLRFTPVRYVPMPTIVDAKRAPVVPLDGEWLVDPNAAGARDRLLGDPAWKRMVVPGQWLQQGIDVPQDQKVAMAREFEVPSSWEGRRVVLRFDAIHAGVTYWLNGRKLGRSENLFTPVEWDVTDKVAFGGRNRLDLEMVVDTVPERLSYSSGYAFHNLGGIDRSVRLFALPARHITALHVNADLDPGFKDGILGVWLGLAGEETVRVSLVDGHGGRTQLHSAAVKGPEAHLELPVAAPRHWTAETPNIYTLQVDLMDGNRIRERVERTIGFRHIEVVGSRLLVNGQSVKLAGACHHEIDPLTGRADTARHAETDIALAKAANLNYIRTSHYPPNEELLEAADRIGMYVEVEAPFCWVGEEADFANLRAYLQPTSAMVDYHHSHPSVLVWSVANESTFNRCFEVSARLIKLLDPSRPTTFNNPDPKQVCDIANVHYAGMPFDEQLKDDPRPVFWGEWFFPVCHEQTDVRMNPGLRELWGAGHASPDSAYGKACAAEYGKPYMQPGEPSGAWSSMVHSQRVLGGAIWAMLDEPFYLPGGKHAGYAWVHGFWGLFDGWRRQKPEAFLAREIFSPVWFTDRTPAFTPGQAEVRLGVENRYSFTDLRDLVFQWSVGGRSGTISPEVAPGHTGELVVPIPVDLKPGVPLSIRVVDASGRTVTDLSVPLLPAAQAAMTGKREAPTVAQTVAGYSVECARLAFVVDARTGAIDRLGRLRGLPITALATPHITRFDFGDLRGAGFPSYEVLPDLSGRVVQRLSVERREDEAVITLKEKYANLEGGQTWRMTADGRAVIHYSYVYSGPEMEAREVGLRMVLPAGFEKLAWRRWSEWSGYPADSISRTVGEAKARRRAKPEATERDRPGWSWAEDMTDMGTADFRSVKLNVLDSVLSNGDGAGIRVHGDGTQHVRACLAPDGVRLHLLQRCAMGPRTLHPGDRLEGEVTVEFLPARR